MHVGGLYGELEQVPLNMDRIHARMQSFRKSSTRDPTEARSVRDIFYARPTECIRRLEEVDPPQRGESTEEPEG